MSSSQVAENQSRWRQVFALALESELDPELEPRSCEKFLQEALVLAGTIGVEETLQTLNQLGNFYRRKGMYKEAEEFSGVATLDYQHSPASASLYFLCYGRLLTRSGDFAWAENSLRSALQCHEASERIDPFLITSIVDGLARVLNEQQRPDEASQLWEKYRQHNLSIG